MRRTSRSISVAVVLAFTAFTAACDMRVDALNIRGIATRAEDPALPADVRAKDLGAYVLFKSAACPDPGADTCLDERAAGFVLPEVGGDGYLKPLPGDALPSEEFARASETAMGNVRFTNDDHPNGTWAYGILLLAPYRVSDENDIDAAGIDAMADDTPFAIGALRIEAWGVADDELVARGLNPANEEGYSVTFSSALDEIAVLDPKETVIEFPVATLGTMRDRIVFPTLFDEERLQSLRVE